MKDSNFKPSIKVDSLFNENVSLEENEQFTLFVKAYYEWLQTITFKLKNVSGTFDRGETVVGASSGAIGIIRQITSTELIVEAQSETRFEEQETITGQTSGATATINSLRENIVRQSGNLINNRTIQKSVGKYVNYLKEELYASIPADYYGNKRLIATKFHDYFQSKSNEQSYRFLFKLLYNEDIEFYYPGDDILRPSDGKFEKATIIRAVVTSRVFEFLDKTIRGSTSGSLANVVDVKTFFVGNVNVAEMSLRLASGNFVAGETITDIDDSTLTTSLYGIVSGFTVNDAGSGYSVLDTITISGDGADAVAVVSSVSDGPINALSINNYGYGYRDNTRASINNTGTGGTGLVVAVTDLANTFTVTSGSNTYTIGHPTEISILARGKDYVKTPTITLLDDVIQSLGLLHESLITIDTAGTGYAVNEPLTFTGGAGSNAAGIVASVGTAAPYGEENILTEDGSSLIQDNLTNGLPSALKSEDWTNQGPVLRIELTNLGEDYTNEDLPTITIEAGDTASGANATFTALGVLGTGANVSVDIANNSVGIGAIRSIEITNPGANYTTATADLSTKGDGNANLTPIVSGTNVAFGRWINDDGKLDYKILQDSLFYQDFSYVIKSGIVLSTYKDVVKKTIHPAGLEIFGEILISNVINLAANFTTQLDVTKASIPEITIKQIISLFRAGTPTTTALEIDIPSNTSFTLSADREVKVITQSEFSDVVNTSIEIVNKIDIPIDRTITQLREIEVDVESTGKFLTTYAELQLAPFATQTIQDYQSITFNTPILFGDDFIVTVNSAVSKNEKITGTVSLSGNTVIGSGTSFTSDFSANSLFIVDGEMFKVTSVANSEYMTINVLPTGSYTNVSAYKQVNV